MIASSEASFIPTHGSGPTKETQVTEIELACGEGLAEQSVLPAKVGQLIAARAMLDEMRRAG